MDSNMGTLLGRVCLPFGFQHGDSYEGQGAFLGINPSDFSVRTILGRAKEHF